MAEKRFVQQLDRILDRATGSRFKADGMHEAKALVDLLNSMTRTAQRRAYYRDLADQQQDIGVTVEKCAQIAEHNACVKCSKRVGHMVRTHQPEMVVRFEDGAIDVPMPTETRRGIPMFPGDNGLVLPAHMTWPTQPKLYTGQPKVQVTVTISEACANAIMRDHQTQASVEQTLAKELTAALDRWIDHAYLKGGA